MTETAKLTAQRADHHQHDESDAQFKDEERIVPHPRREDVVRRGCAEPPSRRRTDCGEDPDRALGGTAQCACGAAPPAHAVGLTQFGISASKTGSGIWPCPMA